VLAWTGRAVHRTLNQNHQSKFKHVGPQYVCRPAVVHCSGYFVASWISKCFSRFDKTNFIRVGRAGGRATKGGGNATHAHRFGMTRTPLSMFCPLFSSSMALAYPPPPFELADVRTLKARSTPRHTPTTPPKHPALLVPHSIHHRSSHTHAPMGREHVLAAVAAAAAHTSRGGGPRCLHRSTHEAAQLARNHRRRADVRVKKGGGGRRRGPPVATS